MTFSKTYRRLAGRAGVMALALALGGCGSLLSGGDKSVPTFDLSAPADFNAPRRGSGLIVIGPPTALQVLDTARIVVEPAPGQITYLDNAQWSDRLPALFQARLIEAFENGNRARSVGRAGDGLSPDYILLSDLRAFGIRAFDGDPRAVVEVSVKIVGNSSGRIVAAEVFSASVPASSTSGPQATQALDAASDEVFVKIVRWASARF
ncbi:ABC-type transport auxiliary lipoprotein family protein [Starkeya koreensis]|uniref:ABC-type transport auxiliary lipoprotein family protein n=1 Tax=Ancylobacter koreensis TaxID=266121 RepID=A0ABT0DQZ4_9HYPH|nr:ABC-type transport auxiliary lipoprotein family protein [Ancylobacter koreensis]